MKQKILSIFIIFSLAIACTIENEEDPYVEPKTEWVFVACEGNYG